MFQSQKSAYDIKNQHMTLKQAKISFLQAQFGNRTNKPSNSWELKCTKSSSALKHETSKKRRSPNRKLHCK